MSAATTAAEVLLNNANMQNDFLSAFKNLQEGIQTGNNLKISQGLSDLAKVGDYFSGALQDMGTQNKLVSVVGSQTFNRLALGVGAALNLYDLGQDLLNATKPVTIGNITTAVSLLCDAVSEIAGTFKAVPWVLAGKTCSFVSGRIGLSFGDVQLTGTAVPIISAIDNINAGLSPNGYSLTNSTITSSSQVMSWKNSDGTFTEVSLKLKNGVADGMPVSFQYSNMGELLSMQYGGSTTYFNATTGSVSSRGLTSGSSISNVSSSAPSEGATSRVAAVNDDGEITGCYDIYVALPGDTVSQLEAQFKLPSGTIQKLNPDVVNRDKIYSGQQLCVGATILDQGASSLPGGQSLGANHFAVGDDVFNDLGMISLVTGIAEADLRTVNPGLNGTLAKGTVINLPPTVELVDIDVKTDGGIVANAPVIDGNPFGSHDSTLIHEGDYSVSSELGNINTSGGLNAIANDIMSDGRRPFDTSLNIGLPTSLLMEQDFSAYFDPGLSGYLLNLSAFGLFAWLPTDPLVLDLDGDGVKLTSPDDMPVLFDMDNDGGSKEQTGWVSVQDGILVHDLSGGGVIDNVSEMISEYYKGTAGSNGTAGTKPFANAFEALKSLNTNGDAVFSSADGTIFNGLRVWVDANHDGKSWIDSNGDGVKQGGFKSEVQHPGFQ